MLEVVVSKSYLTVELENDICYLHFVTPEVENVDIDEFLTLRDVFETTYTGKKGKAVIVNEDENGLIFGESSGGGGNVNTVNNVLPDENKNVNLTADNIPEAAEPQNVYFTAGRVSGVLLDGLSLLVNAAITSTDTILEAFGKLQAQITSHITDATIHVTTALKTKWTSDQMPILVSIPNTDIIASSSIAKLRFTFQENRTLASIPIGELTTAAVGGLFTVDIKKNGVSIFSTLLTFDSGESTTRTAATPAVLTGTISFGQGDYIDIYVTNTGSGTPGQGLQITLPLTK